MNRPRTFAPILCAALLAAAGSALAHARPEPVTPPGVEVPAWSELTPEQRQQLAFLADRWDQMPASRRVHALERLERQRRWDAMTPQQREELRDGLRHFRDMTPELRQKMRTSIAAVRGLPPEQQRQLRETWQALSPEQRRTWLEAGGPGLSPPPER